MKLSRMLLLVILVMMSTDVLMLGEKEAVDDDGDLAHGWIYLSNSPFINTDYHLDDDRNKDSCVDRKQRHITRSGYDLRKSDGIFWDVGKNSDVENQEILNTTFWMEAKEYDHKQILDILPQEGRAFCLSGKHYKDSMDMFDHVDFSSVKELAENEFDIGSHVYPKDYSQINFYRPIETNDLGITRFDRTKIGGFQEIYAPVPGKVFFDRVPWLPEVTRKDPDYFFIQWKKSDDTFFHIRRTFLKYQGAQTPPGLGKDPDPGSRKLEGFIDFTARRGDPNPLYFYRPAVQSAQPHPRCKNPYFVEVTEIEIDGVKLHNWLHITVYIRKENIIKAQNCATGMMKWIMLEVRDSMGLPIGDFNNELPCGASCKCKSPFCNKVNATKQHAMPCMFTPTRAITQPGLFMYGDPKGFNELHATWHFAQHSSYFATELHFAALIVEDDKKHKFYNGRRTKYRNPRRCVVVPRPFTYSMGITEYEHPNYVHGVFHHYTYTYYKEDKWWGILTQDDTALLYYKTKNIRGKVVRPAPGIKDETMIKACNEYKSNIAHYKQHSQKIYLWAWGYPFASIRFPWDAPYPALRSYYPMGTFSSDCTAGTDGEREQDMTHHRWFYTNPEPSLVNSDPLRPEEYYEWSLQHLRKTPRPYGWNAQYTVLKPTLQTLGAWDYFKMNKLIDPATINCHKRLSAENYEQNTKQLLKGRLPLRKNFYSYKKGYNLGDRKMMNLSYRLRVNASILHTPKIAQRYATEEDISDFETVYSRLPLEINVTNPADRVGKLIRMNRVYFGTLGTKLAYEDQRGIPKDEIQPHHKGYDEAFAKSPIGKYFSSLPTVQQIATEERCACPKFGTTKAPELRTERIEVLQGRSAHATQMLLAWIVMIPIGLFVARYYKETYNRVFILEEFWWYSTHLLCMGTALVFMIGGIYSIEVKHITRANFESWSKETKAHILMGILVICLFGLQMALAPFRAWILAHRLLNIMLHFLVGMSNYLVGVAATLIAVAIPQSRMSCQAFYIYVAFLVFQVLMYIFMEAHMRHVDRILMLYPPRTYLPPPVVRVFHTNAPLSQFRLYILAVYVVVCWSFFFIIRYGAIEIYIPACFKNLGNDYEEDA